MKGKKSLLAIVLLASIFLHGSAIFLLYKLNVSGGFERLSKITLSFPLSGLSEKDIDEVSIDEVSEKMDLATEEKISSDFDSLFSISDKPLFSSIAKPLPSNALPQEDEGILVSGFDDTDSDNLLDSKGSIDFSPSTLSDFSPNPSKDKEITLGDHFSYHLEYAPRRYRAGYVFKISLVPRGDIPSRMRQNFYFLFDRSNSIPRGRFFLNKKAISKVLPKLPKDSRFNILVFDDKVFRFSEEPLDCTPENVSSAVTFLENLSHGGYFSSTDIYASLGRVLPKLVSDKEINTAILLSDGDTYLSVENQRILIRNWSEANSGRVTLFCLASGTGNNLTLLELIAGFNKGALLYVADHTQIEDRFGQFILSLQHPIGKDITVSALTLSKAPNLHLLPKAGRLPDLYQDRPFVIYGVANKLEDFTLFLQGKLFERKFDLKKKISFADARMGTLDLERKFTALLVQDYYEQFLKDGKISHLESAKQLLAPLNMAVPFLN